MDFLLSDYDKKIIDDRDLSYGEIPFEDDKTLDIQRLNYPREYLNNYLHEKTLREPKDKDELINITRERIHKNHSVICCFNNANCITTIKVDNMDQNDFLFGTKFASLSSYLCVNLSEDEIRRSVSLESSDIDNTILSYKESIKNKNVTTKMNYLASLINIIFQEYGQYVYIAGGFAFSYYCYINYNYIPKFEDIDFFICIPKDVENRYKIVAEICNKFEIFIKSMNSCCYDTDTTKNFGSYDSDNVIGGSVTPAQITLKGYKIFTHDKDHTFLNKGLRLQIIKRLYISPSECIHGFDVDTSCVLLDNNYNIFCTKRFYNAVLNGYNVVNFEKMSPSYEYRLLKNFKRGIAIWIPFINVLKDVLTLSQATLTELKNKDIKIAGLLRLDILFRKELYHILKREHLSNHKQLELDHTYSLKYSDYNMSPYSVKYIEDGKVYNIEYSFKEINPSEQISNTFHKTVIDKYSTWYGKFFDSASRLDTKYLEDDTVIQVDTEKQAKKIITSNVLSNTFTVSSEYIHNINKVFVRLINHLFPNVTIFGNIIISAFYNLADNHSPKEIYIKFKENLSDEEKLQRMYYIYKVYLIVKIYSSFINPTDLEEYVKRIDFMNPINSVNLDILYVENKDNRYIMDYGNNVDITLSKYVKKLKHHFKSVVIYGDMSLDKITYTVNYSKNVIFIFLRDINSSFDILIKDKDKKYFKVNLLVNIVDDLPTNQCYYQNGILHNTRKSNYLMCHSLLPESNFLVTDNDLWRFLIPSRPKDKDKPKSEFTELTTVTPDVFNLSTNIYTTKNVSFNTTKLKSSYGLHGMISDYNTYFVLQLFFMSNDQFKVVSYDDIYIIANEIKYDFEGFIKAELLNYKTQERYKVKFDLNNLKEAEIISNVPPPPAIPFPDIPFGVNSYPVPSIPQIKFN